MQNISKRRGIHSNCKDFDIRTKQFNLYTDTHFRREKMPGLILNHKMPFFLAFCLIYKTFGLSEFKSERKQKYTNYNSFIEILMLWFLACFRNRNESRCID